MVGPACLWRGFIIGEEIRRTHPRVGLMSVGFRGIGFMTFALVFHRQFTDVMALA